jgi:hypothetical protein
MFHAACSLHFVFASLEASHTHQHILKIAAPAHCFELTMESLFSPCTRLYDLLDSQGGLEALNGHRLNLLQELNLDVPPEELLSAERAFTYTDLFAILGRLGEENTVAWLTPYAYVVRDNERVESWVHLLDGSYRFCFGADDKDIFVSARSHEHLVEICDVIVRLLAASVVQSVYKYN